MANHPLSMQTLTTRLFLGENVPTYHDGAAHVWHFMESLLFIQGKEEKRLVGQEIGVLLQCETDSDTARWVSQNTGAHIAHAAVGVDPALLRAKLDTDDRDAVVHGLCALLAVLLVPSAHVTCPMDNVLDYILQAERRVSVVSRHRIQSGQPFPDLSAPHLGRCDATTQKIIRAARAQHSLQTALTCKMQTDPSSVDWAHQQLEPTYDLPPNAGDTCWISGCEMAFDKLERQEAWNRWGDPAGLVRMVALAVLCRLALCHGAHLWATVQSGESKLGWMIGHASPHELRAAFISGMRSEEARLKDGRGHCKRFLWKTPLPIPLFRAWEGGNAVEESDDEFL